MFTRFTRARRPVLALLGSLLVLGSLASCSSSGKASENPDPDTNDAAIDTPRIVDGSLQQL